MATPTRLPLLDVVARRWRTIAAIAVLTTAAFTVYAFLAPKWYEAELSVVPGSSPKAPLGGAASALAGDLPIDIGLGGSDAERIQAVLKSRSVTDAVIEKFKLTERYGAPFVESTREQLWQHCSTKLEKRPNIVTVACEDKDPAVAQAMTDYFGQVGNKVFRRISASAAAEESAFLERRVAEARHDVDEASQRLRDFEEKHNIIDLPEQSKAVVSALATLKGEELSKEIELGYLNSFSSSDESSALQLRRQLSVMSSKMKALAGQAPPPSGGNAKRQPAVDDTGMFPPASAVPKFRYELAELMREQKVQETVYLLLTQRYEMSKANAARDTSVFQVLDAPVLPTHKTRPKRAKIIVSGMMLGLLLGAAWVVGRSELSQLRPRPPLA